MYGILDEHVSFRVYLHNLIIKWSYFTDYYIQLVSIPILNDEKRALTK